MHTSCNKCKGLMTWRFDPHSYENGKPIEFYRCVNCSCTVWLKHAILPYVKPINTIESRRAYIRQTFGIKLAMQICVPTGKGKKRWNRWSKVI